MNFSRGMITPEEAEAALQDLRSTMQISAPSGSSCSFNLGIPKDYEWFINTWLPRQGYLHMEVFCAVSFDPFSYLAWLKSQQHPTTILGQMIIAKLDRTFGTVS